MLCGNLSLQIAHCAWSTMPKDRRQLSACALEYTRAESIVHQVTRYLRAKICGSFLKLYRLISVLPLQC